MNGKVFNSALSFRYTRLSLLQDAERPGMEKKSSELEAVQLSILTHRDLLRQVTSYPNRKLKQPDFLPYDLADSLSPTGFLPPEPSPAAGGGSSRLKSLQELCNTYFLSLMKEQLADAERRLRGDGNALRTARVMRWLSSRLELTNFLFELWSPEDEEEGAETAEGGPARGKSGVDVCQSEPVSLESFCSCVEEIPIRLEAPGATGTPDPGVTMEMAGSASSGDSIEVLGTEKSYRTQHVEAGSDGRGMLTHTRVCRPPAPGLLSLLLCLASGAAETPVGAADAAVRRADAGARRARVCALRTNSEDSIEVLSTTESIFPDDLTAITEEDDDGDAELGEVQGAATSLDACAESFQVSGSGDVSINAAIERLKKKQVHKDAVKTPSRGNAPSHCNV